MYVRTQTVTNSLSKSHGTALDSIAELWWVVMGLMGRGGIVRSRDCALEQGVNLYGYCEHHGRNNT